MLTKIERNRQTIRATPNPMDITTIVSIYPMKIDEVKHTIQPGRFIIEAGSSKDPAILHVGSSSWWREIDDEQPLLEIPVSSLVVADSVVKDYINGLLEVTPGIAQPGLFYIPGKVEKNALIAHKEKLVGAKNLQDAWFDRLIKLADSLWARTNGNPLAISDTMRLAADALSVRGKPWMELHVAPDLFNCPACGSIANKNYPICGNCKTVINQELYKSLKLEKAV